MKHVEICWNFMVQEPGGHLFLRWRQMIIAYACSPESRWQEMFTQLLERKPRDPWHMEGSERSEHSPGFGSNSMGLNASTDRLPIWWFWEFCQCKTIRVSLIPFSLQDKTLQDMMLAHVVLLFSWKKSPMIVCCFLPLLIVAIPASTKLCSLLLRSLIRSLLASNLARNLPPYWCFLNGFAPFLLTIYQV